MIDLDAQLEFIVDQDAEPTDWDQALAKFLLQLVRSDSWPADTLEPARVRDFASGGNRDN